MNSAKLYDPSLDRLLGHEGGSTPNWSAGGGSGGGSCNVLYGSDTIGPTPSATKGSGPTSSNSKGGDGGNGTGRKFAI
jgi:hypothetical protein